jgi:hypothetical protein
MPSHELTLAMETRSGLISYISHPNMVPSLPNAVMTYKVEDGLPTS